MPRARTLSQILPLDASPTVLRLTAILTVLLLATASAPRAAWAGDPVVFERGQPVRFELIDGGDRGRDRAGQLVRWDDEGFDGAPGGAFGRVRWEEVRAVDVLRLRRRLVELRPLEERRERMLDLLVHLESRDDAARLVERARQEARALGADDAAIATASERAKRLREERAGRDALKAASALEPRSPERGPFASVPWTPVAPADRDAVLADLRTRTIELLGRSGREPTATDGDACIVWSDLGIEDAARVALEFDRAFRACGPLLGVPADDPDRRLRWGKTAVIVLDGADRFRHFEAAAFNQAVPADLGGIAHYDGANVFVVLRGDLGDDARRIELVRGAARAALHRLDSPIRLPRWAHEGLVDWIALAQPESRGIDATLRQPGLAFIRSGGSLERLLDLTWDEGAVGAEGAARPAGYLLTGLLMEDAGDRMRRFIAAAKSGTPWREALERELGRSTAAILARTREFYRFND